MAVPLFTLDGNTQQLVQDGFDTMIIVLGKDCKLILDGARNQCPNCYFDGASMRSTGVYNGTGPRSFSRGPCPVCDGTGYDPASRERVEIRKFSVKRNLKPSAVFGPSTPQFTRPPSLARIKGFTSDLDVVRQAKYLVLDYQHATHTNERYRPISEPGAQGSIVAGRYFIMYLQRDE